MDESGQTIDPLRVDPIADGHPVDSPPAPLMRVDSVFAREVVSRLPRAGLDPFRLEDGLDEATVIDVKVEPVRDLVAILFDLRTAQAWPDWRLHPRATHRPMRAGVTMRTGEPRAVRPCAD